MTETRNAALFDLLVSTLRVEDLRRLLWRMEGYDALVHELPGEAASAQDTHFQAIALLERHGLLTAGFFEAIRALRPDYAAQIAAVAARWDVALASPAPAAPRPPPRLPPRTPPPAPRAVGTLTPPLGVLVAWHPACDEGARLADQIHRWLCRAPEHPLHRGLSVPVRFWTRGDAPPPPLDTPMTATVLVVDGEMMASDAWAAWADDAAAQARADPGDRLFPVALGHNAVGWRPSVSSRSAIRLYDEPAARRDAVLRLMLTHELCRQAQGHARVVDDLLAEPATRSATGRTSPSP